MCNTHDLHIPARDPGRLRTYGEEAFLMEEVLKRSLDDLIYAQTQEKVEATTTISFSVDGEAFEIDLTDTNAALFHESVKQFRDAARSVTGKRKSGGSSKPKATTPSSTSASGGGSKKPTKADDELNKAIREWAREEGGFDLSERGRIPQHVRDAYFTAKNGAPEGTVAEDRLTEDAPPVNFTPSSDADEEPSSNGVAEEPVAEKV
jgi:hypothetical protein